MRHDFESQEGGVAAGARFPLDGASRRRGVVWKGAWLPGFVSKRGVD